MALYHSEEDLPSVTAPTIKLEGAAKEPGAAEGASYWTGREGMCRLTAARGEGVGCRVVGCAMGGVAACVQARVAGLGTARMGVSKLRVRVRVCLAARAPTITTPGPGMHACMHARASTHAVRTPACRAVPLSVARLLCLLTRAHSRTQTPSLHPSHPLTRLLVRVDALQLAPRPLQRLPRLAHREPQPPAQALEQGHPCRQGVVCPLAPGPLSRIGMSPQPATPYKP